MKQFLVTGGAGFIGSAVVRMLLAETDNRVVVVDTLTYAGNMDSLKPALADNRFSFERADICDGQRMRAIFERYQPEVVMHLAAESHVDRSIDGPRAFIETNINGTFVLLQAALAHYRRNPDIRGKFRFHHISTDEVFGSLGEDGLFSETSPYQPRSPYSASKAASDHLVSAWHHTYGLPVIISNCSNNYGPYQFPEKLIPLIILNGMSGKELPIYGSGKNVRDWLHVDDHARALLLIAQHGKTGESYNVGANNELTNLSIVQKICTILDEMVPDPKIGKREGLIRYVADRPGHDMRYAIDARKIRSELGWTPIETMDSGLRKTVAWYLQNEWWWQRIKSGGYLGQRLGLEQIG